MRFILPLLALFCLGLPRALASTPCEGWLAPDFWKAEPSLEDVQRGLSTSPPTVRDEQDATPLHYAAGFGKSPKIITALLQAGADVNALDKNGRTPLHFAARSGRSPAILSALLDAGGDAHAVNKAGKRPLEYAVQNRYLAGSDAILRLEEATRND